MTDDNWSLAALLQPVSWERFVAEYWQRVPLHVRGPCDRFRALVDRGDVDRLLADHCGRSDFPLTVVGGRLDDEAPAKTITARRDWTPDRVRERLKEGATIRIGNIRAWLPQVKRLASEFELELSSDIAVNLYLTPPGSQAFGAHYDNHDVFIVQVTGEKLWKLREPAAELPLEVMFRGRQTWLRHDLPYESRFKTLPPIDHEYQVKLCAGDLLYVPRGHVHEVFTAESESLHLTVAAPIVTWYEVIVHALIAVARRSPKLRTALPVGFATSESTRRALKQKAPDIIQEVVAALRAEDVNNSVTTLADLFVASRDFDFPGGDDAPVIDLAIDDMVEIPPGLACSARVFGADLLLMFAGRTCKLPVRTESMMRYIIAERRFRIAELPTHLGDQSRLVMARVLMTQGMLIKSKER